MKRLAAAALVAGAAFAGMSHSDTDEGIARS